MLITLTVLVVAKKSRTFFSFPCSADELVCRGWQGAQPGSQLKMAKGNIPYHRQHAHCINGGWPGGQELFREFSFFCEFDFSMSLASSAKSSSS